MSHNYYPLIFLAITYLFSAIPFGLLLAQIFAKTDIRKHGSGNIGATNVARIAGKKLGLITLFLDGAKGAIMVIIGRYAFSDYEKINYLLPIIAATAVLGHIFPVYLKFRGGKGVATTMAVLLVINPVTGLISTASWLVAFAFSRVSALASLISIVVTLVFVLYYQHQISEILLITFLMVIIFIRHKENINRLVHGQEKKL